MMTRTLAQELRARLGPYHDALRRMYDTQTTEIPGESQYGWAFGVSSSILGLRDGTEALALLRVLACVDRDACAEEIRAIWPDASWESGPEQYLRDAVTTDHSLVVGSGEDFASITERVETPSGRFRSDVRWLQRALRASVDHLNCCCVNRLISVKVRVLVSDVEFPEDLVDFLRQIERNVQRITFGQDLEAADASAISRLQVVEVRFHKRVQVAANPEAFTCLVRLSELGVRITHLLPIEGVNATIPLSRVSLARSLQALLLPHRDGSSSAEYVCVQANASTFAVTPMVLSAVEANPHLREVNILCKGDRPGRPNDETIQAARKVCRWFAYALFSRHAHHSVQRVTLNVAFLDGPSVDAIKQVVRSEHPLATLFETRFEADQWISASSFLVSDFHDHMAVVKLYTSKHRRRFACE